MSHSLEIEDNGDSSQIIRNLIWTYFWLLIFEGALRKWFLPQLAAPLLIVRDPIAILIYLIARNRGYMPLNGFVISLTFVGIMGIFTSMVSGHGNIAVSLYGARSYLLHFPLIFIIGKVFTRDDVLKMGKMILVISIPMAILIGLQFYSPQTDLVNRGIGGDVNGGGFNGGAMGYFRPPGTFSFTTGVAQFYALVGVFVCYFWLNPVGANLFLLIGATIALLVSIPFSISRTLLYQLAITLVITVIGGVRKPKHALRILIASIAIFFIVFIGGNSTLIQTSLEVLQTRFDNASLTERGVGGTIFDRFIGGLLNALINFQDLPLFGYGLGFGSNVASMLLRGYVDFTIGEDEWTRTIGELGPLLGLVIIVTRVSLTGNFFVKSLKLVLVNDFLPWVLFSVTVLAILQGNWSQATSLGFSVLTAGLNLASLEDNMKDN